MSFCGPNADQVDGVVQGRQIGILLKRCNHLVVQDYRTGELVCAVYYSVADGADFRGVRGALCKGIEDCDHCLIVVLGTDIVLLPFAAAGLGQSGVRTADGFDCACYDHGPRGHVVKPILEGRAAGIDYEDEHAM